MVERERERGRERESEREREKRNERTREKKRMQQIFLCVHADVLYVCLHCTDPDINFTEEREHTHTCTLKRK